MLFLQRSVEVASWFISKEWGKKGGPRFVSPSVGKQSGKLLLFLLFNSRSCFEGAEKREKWRDGLEFEERDFFFFFFFDFDLRDNKSRIEKYYKYCRFTFVIDPITRDPYPCLLGIS